MTKKHTFVEEILWALQDAADMLPRPLETPYGWIRRASGVPYRRYYNTAYHLRKRGLVKISNQKGKKFIQLTEKGKLEALFMKATLAVRPSFWDGKWRIIFFDIPETSRNTRNKIRRLLKRIGFVKLQLSVFISPYALNREAVEYLKEQHFLDYIRIARIDDLDDDKALREHFKLRRAQV